MSRIIFVCAFAALVAACDTETGNEANLSPERLACAELGVDPGNAAFDRCASDLKASLWNEQLLDD
jgi:hypothetical protein